MGSPSFDIKRLMDSSKHNRESQKTKNNFSLLTQRGGITPEAAASALVTHRTEIDRYIDKLLFG